MNSPTTTCVHDQLAKSSAPLTIEEFSSLDQLGTLSSDWDALVKEGRMGPAHEMDWLRILSEEQCKGRKLVVKMLRDSVKVLGGASFVCENEWRKGIVARIIKPLNFFHQLRGTQLILPRFESDVGLQAILGSLPDLGWDLLFMYYQKGEPQEKHFEDYLKNNRYPFTVTLAGQAPFLKLAGTWEEGMTRLHRKFRTELRSREKKLRERGRIELKFMDRQDSWEAGMSAIEEIEQQSWKPTGGFPIIHPHHWSFYYKYAAQAASKSTLCVPILYVNDEPVAFDYGIYHDGTYYLLQTSYKERWNECYPGSVLRKLVIEWLHDIHAEEIDFGIGDDIWKRKWTDATREYRLYTVFNHSLRGNYLSLVSRITKIFGKY